MLLVRTNKRPDCDATTYVSIYLLRCTDHYVAQQ